MSQEVKKEPFAAFFIESSLQAFQYFQKPTWFYLLTTKDILMGKSMRQNFFQCEMPEPLLQRSLLKKWGETRDVVVKPLPACFATEQSKVKASLFVNQNVQDCYEICQNVACFHEWSLNPALYPLSFTLYFVLLIL